MSQYDNTNSGALFKNDKKQKPNHPDYRGTLNVEGVEFWISGWIKQGKNGSFMSLAIQEKQEQARQTPQNRPTAGDDEFSDVPF